MRGSRGTSGGLSCEATTRSGGTGRRFARRRCRWPTPVREHRYLRARTDPRATTWPAEGEFSRHRPKPQNPVSVEPGLAQTSRRVRRFVVVSTRFCAGLTPGKNLRMPNPRKTAPTATRRRVMLCRTRVWWRRFSTCSKRLIRRGTRRYPECSPIAVIASRARATRLGPLPGRASVTFSTLPLRPARVRCIAPTRSTSWSSPVTR